MNNLNYHHLLYFWVVARLGSVVRASAELRLAQPTISGQLRRLEDVLGVKLFDRVGRRLVLTEVGHTTFRFADEIFTLGQDLVDTLHGRPTLKPMRLAVGVTDALPKRLVMKLLEPVFRLEKPIELICREDRAVEEFLEHLHGHDVDMVLADRPLGPGVKVNAVNHLLGDCGTTLLASAELAKAYRRGFPHSLGGAPFLLPGSHATVRRGLDHWFEEVKLEPRLVAEFDDSALMFAFGEEGKGIFPSPTAFEAGFRQRYNVHVVGRIPSVRQHFYAISADRRTPHPALAAIVEGARGLFGVQPPRTRGARAARAQAPARRRK